MFIFDSLDSRKQELGYVDQLPVVFLCSTKEWPLPFLKNKTELKTVKPVKKQLFYSV